MYLADQVKSTPEGRRLYEREGLIFRVTEQIAAAMEERGIKKSELAERMATTRSYITQLLNGSENMTLAKLAEVMFALGLRADITITPLNSEHESTVDETDPYCLVYTLGGSSQRDFWQKPRTNCRDSVGCTTGAA